MSSLDKEQQLQEKLYTFPYHHIPQYEGRTFSQTRALPWGYQYISYIYFILSKIEKLQFNSLLDVGCGDGKFLVEVSKVFPSIKLVGVDFSERAIGYAKAFNPNIEFLCGDITDPSLIDEKFHIVTIIETLEHISPTELPKFVKGLHNCLKDDGTLVLTVPSTNSPLRGKHFQHFSDESLEKILKPN